MAICWKKCYYPTRQGAEYGSFVARGDRVGIKERMDVIRYTYRELLAREAMDTQRKETILVIDDEPVVVEVLRGLLSKEGFEVESAPDGLEGLAAPQEDRPGLSLLHISVRT